MKGLHMITIDSKQYELDSLSSNAEKQLNSIQFVNSELAQIQAESIGWIALGEGTYIHLSSAQSSDNTVIEVVGLPKPEMQGSNVFWLF